MHFRRHDHDDRRGHVDDPHAVPGGRTLCCSHGGDTWAVVLAGVPGSDYYVPPITEAIAAAWAAGYRPSTGDAGCDQGSVEAMGLPDGGLGVTVSVYLRTEADAERALRAFHQSAASRAAPSSSSRPTAWTDGPGLRE